MMYKVRRFLKGLKKEMDWNDTWFRYTGRRSIDNLWTGYEAGGKTKAVAGGAAAIGLLSYGGYQIYQTPLNILGEMAKEQDVESLPGTRGDMQGYTAYSGNVGPGIEVSGDLVFALHKLRHGG
jgi:hypothetical protein